MQLFSHSSAESRLLNISARQIREEALARQRADAAATRASQAYASTGGVNPDAARIQSLVRTNFDQSRATPQQIADHNRGMALASATTGAARVAAAPTKNSLTTGARGIAGATGDITKSVLTGQGVIEQAAIKRLREGDPTTGVKGLTDEEIKVKMADPVYQKSIRDTMSNTGMGGSFDLKGNFHQSEAIDVLGRLGLTVGGSIDGRASLNVTEDKLRALEAAGLVAGVGGKREDGTYTVSLNVGDRDLQEQYERRKQEADRSNAALMEVQRREQEKATAQETANLKAREGTKDFTSTIDTASFDETTKQVTDLMTSIKGLTPDLQAAILPGLLGLQRDNADIKKMAEEMKATLSTDAEIEASYADQESYYKDQSTKYEALLEKNKNLQLEVANYNKEAMEIEKKMIDHDAAVSEQKQAQANIENEKKLRRQLNKLGINTDVQGLTFLNDEIQKGVDALENLKTANNLVSLKAQLAIGKGYSLEVKGILNDYEGKYLEITSKTQEALNSVKNSISLAKSERDKEMRSIIKDSYEKKAANDKEARNFVFQAHTKMIDMSRQLAEDQRRGEEDALNKIEYLLKNYPREAVAGAIKDLAKNITSFDATTLANNPTLAEIQKAKKSVSRLGGGAAFNDFLPSSMQEQPTPEIPYEEFTKSKLSEMEGQEFQSFSPEKRAELLIKNEAKWKKEYEAMYVSALRGAGVANASSEITQQFGENVLSAAELVLNGTYGGTNPIKRAADAQGVSESTVAIAVNKLRQSGYVIDTKTLSPEQQKGWDGIRSELNKDPFYTVWNGSKSAVTAIQTAINTGGGDGLPDIMAINAFQRGIVDPGATVREGDVALMQTAVAWSEQVNMTYWKEKISKGAKMPDSMRQRMLQLANATQQAYGKDFNTVTVPRMKTLVRQKGLPPSVLDDYLGDGATVSGSPAIVSPEVQKFSDTYFSK